MTPSYALRLDSFIADGRLIRRNWTGTDAAGRETACLLAALSPEVAKEHDPAACPANIMPSWLAHLTPWIDDRGSLAAWPEMVRRYASLAHRWHVLSPSAWNRLDYRFRIAALDEASEHYDHKAYPRVAAVVARVRALCTRAADGDMPGKRHWAETARAAEAAETVAVAARAVAVAEARAATATAARAVVWAVAATAARAVAWAVAVAWAAEAEAEAVDRLTAALFDLIEAEIALTG